MKQCGCWNDTASFRAAIWGANPLGSVIAMGQVIVIPVSFLFCYADQRGLPGSKLSLSPESSPVQKPEELNLAVDHILTRLNKSTESSATPILFFASTTSATHLGTPISSNDPSTISAIIMTQIPAPDPRLLTICVVDSVSDLFGYAQSPWDAKQLLSINQRPIISQDDLAESAVHGELHPGTDFGIVLCNVHSQTKRSRQRPSSQIYPEGRSGETCQRSSSQIYPGKVEVPHLLHQLGHWFGLDHSEDPSDLMCPTALRQKGDELVFGNQQLDRICDAIARFKPFLIHPEVPAQYQAQYDHQVNDLVGSYDFRSNWGWKGEMILLGNSFLTSNARIVSDNPYQGTHSLRLKTGGAGELAICLERYREATLKVMYYAPEYGALIMVRPPGYVNPDTDDWYVVHLERNTMYDEVSVLLPGPYHSEQDEGESWYTIRFGYRGHGKQTAYFDCMQVRTDSLGQVRTDSLGQVRTDSLGQVSESSMRRTRINDLAQVLESKHSEPGELGTG